MRQATDPQTFAGSDAAYVAGPSWLYLRAEPTTYAIVFFGRPTVDDIGALTPLLATELVEGVPRHVSLVDASRLDGVDPAAFLALHRYVSDNRARLGEKVARLGLVRPAGFAGAVVAGFYALLDRQVYPTRVAASVDDAARFIERPELPAILAPLVESLDATAAIVRRLQQLFLAQGFDQEIADAARALALSPRTLQRRLQEAETSFVDVRLRARLERAKERMLDEATPLTAIALDFGFASTQHFSVAFKKETGRTPTAWREEEQARRALL